MAGKMGGARPGAGRKPGKVGKAKRELAEMAKEHCVAALQTLADIARSGESEAARVSAATAILDRGYGKPSQAVMLGGKVTVRTLADFYGSGSSDSEEDDDEN